MTFLLLPPFLANTITLDFIISHLKYLQVFSIVKLKKIQSWSCWKEVKYVMEADSSNLSREVTPEQDPAPATERDEHQTRKRFSLSSLVLVEFLKRLLRSHYVLFVCYIHDSLWVLFVVSCDWLVIDMKLRKLKV